MFKKLVAEVIGTFILVFLGTCAIVFMGPDIGKLGIALAFGLGVIAAAYGIGAVSGAHLNPAVSLGMVAAGRMQVSDLPGYVGAQVVGAIGAIVVIMALGGTVAGGLGQTAVGSAGPTAALIFEFVATFLFVTVILGATAQGGGGGALAGLVIGLTLVLIHLAGINISGASVNPARVTGAGLVRGRCGVAADLALYRSPSGGRFACRRAAQIWAGQRACLNETGGRANLSLHWCQTALPLF